MKVAVRRRMKNVRILEGIVVVGKLSKVFRR
jgi:hypothetical protein